MAKKSKNQKPKRKAAPPRGARSFWSGTISFGLVNVPVDLFPANRRAGVAFRMLDSDGTPLQRRYYCPEEDVDVQSEHIIRGFPLGNDEYVIVRDDELEAIEPKKSREIDLRRFVDLSDISPMFFHRAYFLTPSGDSNKAYRLLAQVMQESGRAGIATFVMRDREYLIAILAEAGILRAETLRFQDEVRDPAAVGLPAREKPSFAIVAKLERLIQKQTADDLKKEWLTDEYAQRVRTLVERKRRKGQGVIRTESDTAESETEDDAPPPDLIETIRRSLQTSNGAQSNGRKRRGQVGEVGELKDKSKDELYEHAQKLNISGRSKLNKEELIQAIRRAKSIK